MACSALGVDGFYSKRSLFRDTRVSARTAAEAAIGHLSLVDAGTAGIVASAGIQSRPQTAKRRPFSVRAESLAPRPSSRRVQPDRSQGGPDDRGVARKRPCVVGLASPQCTRCPALVCATPVVTQHVASSVRLSPSAQAERVARAARFSTVERCRS